MTTRYLRKSRIVKEEDSEEEEKVSLYNEEEKIENNLIDSERFTPTIEQENDNYVLELKEKKLTNFPDLSNSKFTRLRSIDLSFNPINRIMGIDRLLDLRELKLVGCNIKEIENLERNTKLERLLLSGNKIKTIPELMYNLKHLKTLDLEGNLLSTIQNLNHCTSLTNLNLSLNKIENISGLDSFLHLETLDLSDNKLTNLNGCKKLKNLTFFNAGGNDIINLEGLNGMRKLNTLYLNNNKLTDLSTLPRLVCLEELFLENNLIVDVSMLNVHTQRLQILDLKNNCLKDKKDLECLGDINALEEIFVEGNLFIKDKVVNIIIANDIKRMIPSLHSVDSVDVINDNIEDIKSSFVRPSTPNERRPQTPRLNKEVIPLIRPSSARDNGQKKVLPIANIEEMSVDFKSKIAQFRKNLQENVPLLLKGTTTSLDKARNNLQSNYESKTNNNAEDEGEVDKIIKRMEEEEKVEYNEETKINNTHRKTSLSRNFKESKSNSNTPVSKNRMDASHLKSSISHSPISSPSVRNNNNNNSFTLSKNDVLLQKVKSDSIVILGRCAPPSSDGVVVASSTIDLQDHSPSSPTPATDTPTSSSEINSPNMTELTTNSFLFNKSDREVVTVAANRPKPSDKERNGYTKFKIPKRSSSNVNEEEVWEHTQKKKKMWGGELEKKKRRNRK